MLTKTLKPKIDKKDVQVALIQAQAEVKKIKENISLVQFIEKWPNLVPSNTKKNISK